VQHRIIVRAAWGLSISLVLCATAFAWATNRRERQYEALLAEAAPAAPSTPAQPPSPEAARAVFEKRCATCHDPEQVNEWAETLGADRGAAALAFLQAHKKGSDAENRLLAAYVGAKGSL